MAHEFAHMQRNDFMKNLFYEALVACDLPSAALGDPRAGHGEPRNDLRPDGCGHERTKGVRTISLADGFSASAGEARQNASYHRNFRYQRI